MVGWLRRIYYVMNWDYPKDIVDEKIKAQRHKVMIQIKNHNIKLKDVYNKTEQHKFDLKIKRQRFLVHQQIKLSHLRLRKPPEFQCDCSETEDATTDEHCDCF